MASFIGRERSSSIFRLLVNVRWRKLRLARSHDKLSRGVLSIYATSVCMCAVICACLRSPGNLKVEKGGGGGRGGACFLLVVFCRRNCVLNSGTAATLQLGLLIHTRTAAFHGVLFFLLSPESSSSPRASPADRVSLKQHFVSAARLPVRACTPLTVGRYVSLQEVKDVVRLLRRCGAGMSRQALLDASLVSCGGVTVAVRCGGAWRGLSSSSVLS